MNKVLRILTIASIPISIVSGLVTIFSEDNEHYAYIIFLIAAIIILIYFLFNKGDFHFKVLDQDISLDIINDKGSLVKYKGVKKLKCLKKHANEYIYSFSTAGTIENIKVDNGTIKEIKKEDGRIIIVSVLSKPLKKGEEVNHILTCDFIDSFTKEDELWTLKRNDAGKGKCTLTILFPATRLFKTFKAYKVKGNSEKVSDEQPEIMVVNNKSSLRFEIKRFKLHDVYKVKWIW